jgi:hypothetical protein
VYRVKAIELVSIAAEQFATEMDDLFSDVADPYPWNLALNYLKPDDLIARGSIISTIVLLMLQSRCGYEFRVLEPVRTYPLRLAWLVLSAPDERCNHRKAVAAELVAMDTDTVVDGISHKLVKQFRAEFDECAVSGILAFKVYELVNDVLLLLLLDTQDPNDQLGFECVSRFLCVALVPCLLHWCFKHFWDRLHSSCSPSPVGH